MNATLAVATASFLIASTAGFPAGSAFPQQAGSPSALALSHFEDRVKDYLAVRQKVEASLTPPRPSSNPREITSQQETLAQAVRKARGSAKQGDIFIPEVAPVFREVIREDFSQRTPRERTAALQEVPAGLGLKVNDEYPKSAPLATMPPKLLAAMPRLPDALEYRLVGRRLILHDTATNLVVDILEAAIPQR